MQYCKNYGLSKFREKIVAVLPKTPGVGNHCWPEQLRLKGLKGEALFQERVS